MYHYESQSRDPKVNPEENMSMKNKWDKYIKYDPYYNINLSKGPLSGIIFSIDA
jgi:hypothetical protein